MNLCVLFYSRTSSSVLSLSLSPFFTSNLTIEFFVLHDEFDEGESMPSAGGSIEGKNSVPIVREAVPLARLPAGPTMFLERQDYRSTRRVIYESSVLGGRALCSSSSRAPRRRRSRSSALTYSQRITPRLSACARSRSAERLAAKRVSFFFFPLQLRLHVFRVCNEKYI